ncbi:VOC family protein [Lysinibacillus telephonicus]|uniref:Glyoxalase/bleomycin resistance/extradiol dioxygenase family protein n=1 Tax=Lysinibacillus telephonicus TaxID=1714840 RepID=A0A431UC59_9BACI|nr:VOC family protein [Lysinibacillus telephonicus]RTQ86474.1 glyoxalase/bleomycin resistance/extradiol dioxygenase family protein [Lysinibacillus telephonicus]
MTFKPSMTFINLPVKDLKKSMSFFEQIGFSFNMQFTDDNAACMVINDHTFSMLLTEAHFKNFTSKEIVDATRQTESLISLAVESREQVDAIVEKAIAAGGSLASDPRDYGFMYQVGFQDLDGHIWEVFYMEQGGN